MKLPIQLRPHTRSLAFMLVDCLVFIAVWFTLTALIFSAFYRSLGFSRNLIRGTEDISLVLQAGERWREDIRAATNTIRIVDSRENTEQAVHIPQKQGEVVYLFSQSTLYRKERIDRPWLKVLGNVRSSSISADQRQHVTAWRWELELKARDLKSRIQPLFTFSAVPSYKSAR